MATAVNKPENCVIAPRTNHKINTQDVLPVSLKGFIFSLNDESNFDVDSVGDVCAFLMSTIQVIDFGVGIIRPDWLEGATYLGEEECGIYQ